MFRVLHGRQKRRVAQFLFLLARSQMVLRADSQLWDPFFAKCTHLLWLHCKTHSVTICQESFHFKVRFNFLSTNFPRGGVDHIPLRVSRLRVFSTQRDVPVKTKSSRTLFAAGNPHAEQERRLEILKGGEMSARRTASRYIFDSPTHLRNRAAQPWSFVRPR